MASRTYNSTDYRYGFNGKENDPEMVSTGEGTQDYGFRIYNPAIGKFLSVDPLTYAYPPLTPYQFASNCPIAGVDLDGLEFYYAADGSFIGQGDDPNNKLVIVVTYKDVEGMKEQQRVETIMTYKGIAVSHGEFLQYAATVYNETYENNTVDPQETPKQQVADAIYNRGDNMGEMYPAKKKADLQMTIDHISKNNDCHADRMTDKRKNPKSTDKIPGTNIPLVNVRTKHYAEFYSATTEERNKNSE